jgi:hypothetical protein
MSDPRDAMVKSMSDTGQGARRPHMGTVVEPATRYVKNGSGLLKKSVGQLALLARVRLDL